MYVGAPRAGAINLTCLSEPLYENFLTNTGIYEKQMIGLWFNLMVLTLEIEEFNGNPLNFKRM